MPDAHRSNWQLPPGVPRGVWDYTHEDHVARQYDEYFAENHLFAVDEQILARCFSQPGLVIDLGCGTGRALLPLARRGFRCLGVDLSLPMLQVVGQKAKDESLRIDRIQANLVQLDCFRDDGADYAVCLFSTLGMIHGRDNRLRALRHVRRILKPGGLFVLHVHNVCYNLYNPRGRRWLARHLGARLLGRHVDPGDKFFVYRGIPKMYLHTFTQHELTGSLAATGFRLKQLIPLAANRRNTLRWPWLLGRWRANGWVAICEG